MVERSGYVDGEPCWADLVAPDLAAAQRFYSTLFGWTFSDPATDTGADFGHYVMCLKDGKVVAGMSPPMPGAEQTPAAWSLYLMSHDLEDTARHVDAGGGKVIVAPMDIPDNGRMLFALDPSGAAFGVWEPGQHTGSQLFDEDGALCWAEINTREPDAVDTFYQGLFGYRQTRVEADEQFDYTAWSLGNADPVAGRLTMTEAWEGIPSHWMVYFAAADTDRAVDRVQAAGGQVQHGPFESPHGRIAVVVDPNGAVFTVISR
jgi:predicted enzyme related to lactoylglutathione lyase